MHRLLVLVTAALCGCGSQPEPPAPVDLQAQRCLALAMYWEAKAESQAGLEAVGHVVMNRLHDTRFPDSVCAVVKQGGERKGCQFSWYCDGRSDKPTEADNWQRANTAAQALLRGELQDNTGGALFFHAKRIEIPWRVQRTHTRTVGNHVFYK